MALSPFTGSLYIYNHLDLSYPRVQSISLEAATQVSRNGVAFVGAEAGAGVAAAYL